MEGINNNVRNRDSGIDLIRAISVFLIVIGHLQSETNICQMMPNSNITIYLFENIIGNAERYSINCFIMVSAWYLTGKNFSTKRFIKNWITVFLLNVFISIVCVLVGVASWKNIFFFQAFLPIIGRPQWYMCEYLLLLLTYPFIDVVINKVNRKQQKILIVYGFVFIVLVESVRTISSGFATPLFSEYIWFVYIFIFVNYIKKYNNSWINNIRSWIWLCVALFSYLSVVGIRFIADLYRNSFLMDCSQHLISDYAALPGFIYAVGIFQGLKDCRIKNKIGSFIAMNSGVIYIIHSVPLLWRTEEFRIWTSLLNIYWWEKKGVLTLGMIITSLVVIIIGIAIGELIKHTVLRFVDKSELIRKLSNKIDGSYFINI